MSMKVRASAVAVFAALALAAGSSATTQPTKYRTVSVVLTDKGIKLAVYFLTYTHEGNVAGPALIPRGDYVSFTVVNVGKKRHNFTIFGHETAALRHGQKTHFSIAATIRGRFPYASTLDKGKTFHGYISVA
jgi:hypothetical protein